MNTHQQLPPGFPGARQQQVNIKLEEKDQLFCDCGCKEFQAVVHLFKIPKIAPVPNAGEVLQLLVFKCCNCGEVLQKERANEAGTAAKKHS